MALTRMEAGRPDDVQDILEDINAIGNRAIEALKEVTVGLDAANEQLRHTKRALASSRSHEELVYQGGIIALLKAIEAKDDTTGHHVERMVILSLEIARLYDLSDLELLRRTLFIAALHDIGKVGIRDEVLHKPGPLTDEERAHIKTHPLIGAGIVSSLPGWEAISRGVLAHHEWWDGTGYPHGLAGENIPLEARIVAVADVFDALTSRRPYRQPFSYTEARVHIELESGSHFDPQVVAAFLKASEARWEELRETAERATLETLLQRPLSDLVLQTFPDLTTSEAVRPLGPVSERSQRTLRRRPWYTRREPLGCYSTPRLNDGNGERPS
jgi:HD-GYP domain-containing protein (c-di-GMP phosphodiesterase class II)